MIPIIYADIIDDAEDLALFEEIYEEYYRQMFFKANKILNDTHESEDAVHDAFIGIARNMKTVRAIQEKADLYYYMVRAAENAAYNRTRQTRHLCKRCAAGRGVYPIQTALLAHGLYHDGL